MFAAGSLPFLARCPRRHLRRQSSTSAKAERARVKDDTSKVDENVPVAQYRRLGMTLGWFGISFFVRWISSLAWQTVSLRHGHHRSDRLFS